MRKVLQAFKDNPERGLLSFLYGVGLALLILDLLFLVKALIIGNLVPILPVIVGVLTTVGLLFLVRAEWQAREEDKREHRRISRVTHQLSNPLKSLQLDLAELMKDANQFPAEARLKLKHMETKTTVLLDNIRDVFLMLQAHTDTISGEHRTYNLCTLTATAVKNFQPQAKARNVELIYKSHCQDAPVKLDRSLFLLALTHLLENATAYTMKPGLVNVGVIKSNKQTRIVVQDRGIGISSSDELILWQPFARGDRATEYDPDGIGVGLTLAHRIAREFGGKLTWSRRQPGTGTEFEISLPLAPG